MPPAVTHPCTLQFPHLFGPFFSSTLLLVIQASIFSTTIHPTMKNHQDTDFESSRASSQHGNVRSQGGGLARLPRTGKARISREELVAILDEAIRLAENFDADDAMTIAFSNQDDDGTDRDPPSSSSGSQ
jgi:cytochrome P450